MSNIFALFDQWRKTEPDKAGPVSFLVAGLGNPGKEYERTRHNAGFLALSYLAQKERAQVDRIKFKALCGECTLGGVRTLLLAPQTFMNNSGEAVAAAASYYRLPPERVLVIFDDTSLDVGTIRIRKKGSDGGHNGIKSIICHLGTDQFPRIKIGIGQKPDPRMDLADYVLGRFSDEDCRALFAIFDNVCAAVGLIAQNKADEAMNRFN